VKSFRRRACLETMVLINFILLLWASLAAASLPDASQEGLVRQYRGHATLAIFHYRVPQETARATWEFASFQVQNNIT
jgi:hypothetical protein